MIEEKSEVPNRYELIDDQGVTRGLYETEAEAQRNAKDGWTVRESGEFVHQRAVKGPVKP